MTTMKIRVTRVDDMTVTIPDEALTEEAIAEFKSYMFHVDGPEGLFKFAAAYTLNNHTTFVEGLGRVEASQEFVDVESEILKDEHAIKN